MIPTSNNFRSTSTNNAVLIPPPAPQTTNTNTTGTPPAPLTITVTTEGPIRIVIDTNNNATLVHQVTLESETSTVIDEETNESGANYIEANDIPQFITPFTPQPMVGSESQNSEIDENNPLSITHYNAMSGISPLTEESYPH